MSPDQAPRVARLPEDDWRVLREVRLAALADAPASFASTYEVEAGYDETRWRTMARTGAIHVATVAGVPVGMAAGVPREPAEVPGLGAMWVSPSWRGSGLATGLVAAVVGWARREGSHGIGLWVPDDAPRARRCYERAGFATTGRVRPFPGSSDRTIVEMFLPLR